MKESIFNIAQKYNEGILLYNTFSTALVELENSIYSAIFLNGSYELYEESKALYEMGFLIDDDKDEIETLKKIRNEVIANSSEKIGNIIIAPTLECNAHCYYCFENGQRKGTMDYDTAESLVQFLKNRWNKKELGITWFGGEPLLAKDVISFISRRLKEEGVRFSCKITTNGSLFDEKMIMYLLNDWCVEKIQVTVDAVGDKYNKIKNYDAGFKNPFEKIMENIQKLIDNGIKVKVRINFNPEKQNEALDTMDYLTERFHNSDNIKIYFAPIDENDEIVRNIANDFDEFNEHPYISLIKFGRKNNLYRGFPDMEDDNKKINEETLLKKLKIYPSTINCYAACPNVITVGPDGGIYKCHRVLGRKEYESGNIKNGIVENDAYHFFCSTDEVYDECKDCNVLPVCQGGCKVNARLYSKKEACAPCKAIIKDLILLYKEDLDKFKEKEAMQG